MVVCRTRLRLSVESECVVLCRTMVSNTGSEWPKAKLVSKRDFLWSEHRIWGWRLNGEHCSWWSFLIRAGTPLIVESPCYTLDVCFGL